MLWIFSSPQNYIRMGTDPNVSQNLPFGVMDSRLIFRLKVIRPFINMVEIPRQVMFTVYVTSTPYDPLVTPVYTISFGGRVEVPQNCELNAGQIVEFDFGDIGASLFSAAGPGIDQLASCRKPRALRSNVRMLLRRLI